VAQTTVRRPRGKAYQVKSRGPARPAHDDEAGFDRQASQAELEVEGHRLRLVLDQARPHVLAVDFAARQQLVHLVNLHGVITWYRTLKALTSFTRDSSRRRNRAPRPTEAAGSTPALLP
jgi:hypothetical protein